MTLDIRDPNKNKRMDHCFSCVCRPLLVCQIQQRKRLVVQCLRQRDPSTPKAVGEKREEAKHPNTHAQTDEKPHIIITIRIIIITFACTSNNTLTGQ